MVTLLFNIDPSTNNGDGQGSSMPDILHPEELNQASGPNMVLSPPELGKGFPVIF
jgi:hypothetical protein